MHACASRLGSGSESARKHSRGKLVGSLVGAPQGRESGYDTTSAWVRYVAAHNAIRKVEAVLYEAADGNVCVRNQEERRVRRSNQIHQVGGDEASVNASWTVALMVRAGTRPEKVRYLAG